MMCRVKQHMTQQSGSGDCSEERRFNRILPGIVSSRFNIGFKHLIPFFDQSLTEFGILALARVGLTHGRILHLYWKTKKQAKQIHHFARVPIDKADRSCIWIESKRGILGCNLIEGKRTSRLVLGYHVKKN